MKELRYVMGCDYEGFSICVMREDGIIEYSGTFDNEADFNKQVQEASKHYNTEIIKEYEGMSKKHKLVGVPNINIAFKTFLNSEKGKQLLVDYFADEDLIKEIYNYEKV